MRKKVIFTLIVMLCLSIGGCVSLNEEKKFKVRNTSDDLQGNQIMEEIVAALDTGDVERLKKMFSEAALMEYDEWAKSRMTENGKMIDLDEQISDVMEFYEGMMVISYDRGLSSASKIRGKVVFLELNGQYTLETDQETYEIVFDYKTIDNENPKEIGLSKLEIVKKKDYDREGFEWKFYDKALGIYWQDYDEENSKWYFYGEGPDIESEED